MSDFVITERLRIPLARDGGSFVFRGDSFVIAADDHGHGWTLSVSVGTWRWEGNGESLDEAEIDLTESVRRPGPRAGADALSIASITSSMQRRAA